MRLVTLVRTVSGIALAACIAAGFPAAARERQERKGGWFGVELGYGRLRLKSSHTSELDGQFAATFKGGYVVNQHFLLGVQANGWLLQPSNLNDPSRGATLSQALVVTQLYPMMRRNLFVKLGAGYASLSDNRPSKFGSDGWGATVGLGCDVPISKLWAVSAMVNYSRGKLDDVGAAEPPIFDREYQALDVMIGFTLP